MQRAISPASGLNLTEIVIPQIADNQINDLSLEPQMIKVRASNSSHLFISSNDQQTHINYVDRAPVDIIVGQQGNNMMMRKIVRMAVTYVDFVHKTPQVNSRNNQIRIFVEAVGFWVNIVLPQHYFYNPTDLRAWIANEIDTNADFVAAALTVIWQTSPTIPNGWQMRLVIGGVDQHFYIDYRSSALVRGVQLYNIMRIIIDLPDTAMDASTPSAATLIVLKANSSIEWAWGPFRMLYSSYVDFHSHTLLKHTKNPSASSLRGANSLLFRINLRGWQGRDDLPFVENPNVDDNYSYSIANPAYFNLLASESLSSIDIRMSDEFGEEWFVPTLDVQFQQPFKTFDIAWNGNLYWSIAFLTEI